MPERSQPPFAATLRSPQLNGPSGEATAGTEGVVFSWHEVPDARGYWLEVARDPRFTDIIFDSFVGRGNSLPLRSLLPADGSTFYWRMRTRSIQGWGAYGKPVSFRLSPAPEPEPVPAPTGASGAGTVSGTPSAVRSEPLTLPTISVPEPQENGPVPQRPRDGIPSDAGALVLEWSPWRDDARYHLQIATDERFTDLIFDAPVGQVNELTLFDAIAPDGSHYFWRVRGQAGGSDSDWSRPAVFTGTTPEIAHDYHNAQVFAAQESSRIQNTDDEKLMASIDLVSDQITSPREVSIVLTVMLTSFLIMLAVAFVLSLNM